MYLVEGEQSGFVSIPVSVYWCIVTLTTVGFGDIAPVTPLGAIYSRCYYDYGVWNNSSPNGNCKRRICQQKKNLL